MFILSEYLLYQCYRFVWSRHFVGASFFCILWIQDIFVASSYAYSALVLFHGWVLLLAIGIYLVPVVKCYHGMQTIADLFVRKLFLVQSGVSCQLQMVFPLDHHPWFTPDAGSTFFNDRCLLSFFMSLCREIIVYISLTASWILNGLCATASNCSYPDTSMCSLMFLSSILFSYKPPSHHFQAWKLKLLSC